MLHIFIINPFAGDKNFADNLRAKLDEIKGLDYFVFNTRYKGYESELVRKIRRMFEGEELRFYCCGGSGTMRNILNGFDDISEAEVAFFPCGLTNDFLKMFGKDEPRFSNIEELINGDVINVDYIRTNHGVCLNTLSTGLDSNSVSKMNDFRILRYFGSAMPYTFAILYSIFVSKTAEYEVTFDDKSVSGKFAEVFVGNGCVFGGNLFFAENTCVDDGKAILRIVGNKRGFPLLYPLSVITGKKYDKHEKIMLCNDCRKIRFCRKDGDKFTINQDGDLIKDIYYCEAEIVRKGLRFVVPKGVKL